MIRPRKPRPHRHFRYFGTGCVITIQNDISVLDVIWSKRQVFAASPTCHLRCFFQHILVKWRKHRWGRNFLRRAICLGFYGTRSLDLIALMKADDDFYNISGYRTQTRRDPDMPYIIFIDFYNTSCTRNTENTAATDIFVFGICRGWERDREGTKLEKISHY